MSNIELKVLVLYTFMAIVILTHGALCFLIYNRRKEKFYLITALIQVTLAGFLITKFVARLMIYLIG